ncbi:MAG: DEAD/DEAH box helicase [Candidatus Cohnella colombiensis]|uniref:DEAD/DEAH box helicase n=1 Tax=Candidatus Cohnella colombiensis TaxID=3121368 RepID=A0AA95F082_9BACL|nr:MAG: DEAD/DEAH box helicase [Cohnella sp.]
MEETILSKFHPVISSWFQETFGEPTEVQCEAWQSIRQGNHTLIAAPTGSGKTLAALLPCLDQYVQSSFNGEQTKGVYILYISPLKALNNDIHHHALKFVEQLDQLAADLQVDWPGIRSAVRTGDTSQSMRSAILRRPPQLLVTTPESLYLLLTSEKGRVILQTVRHVIVDEIHDLAANKRGSHLSLSLERLTALCITPPQRIGVSATQKPIARVAQFLGGWEKVPDSGTNHSSTLQPRHVSIVESAMDKTFRVQITMPDPSKPVATREAVWLPLLDRIVQAMDGCRSVLIFANSRRLCERVCLRLNDHVGYEIARSHHGSMSRERRLEVEQLLKDGELRCIVATSSLELGIDIGHIDLVIQLDSPIEAARGIQRMGRAGHAVGDVSNGILLGRQKALLPELAVLSKQIKQRDIEPIQIPQQPMDVLSQQLLAMVAIEDWNVEQVYQIIRRSDSYHLLKLAQLEEIVQVLSGYYPFVRPLLDWERGTNMLLRRKNTAIATFTGVGTIQQSSSYPVHHLESRAHLGELDEEFIHESRVGDVFLLGSGSWMIREIRSDRVYVSEAGNRFSEIPFWRNEAGGRSFLLGQQIGAFLREIAERLQLVDEQNESQALDPNDPIFDYLLDQYGMERIAAEEMLSFIRSQYHACGLPTDRQIIIEHYRDVMNQTHVILHNHCGRKVNRAWLLAIERQFDKLFPYRMYANAKDNGIEFVLPEWDASWLQVIGQVTPSNFEELLSEAVTGSPLLAINFRNIAETALLLSRSFTRVPTWQKRLRGEQLLRDCLPYAEQFPFLREAMDQCLYVDLAFNELKQLLTEIQEGKQKLVIRETAFPSPFATQFLADYVNMRIYEGDGVDESIQLQLMNVSKQLAGQLFGTAALGEAINPHVLEEEQRKLNELDHPPQSAEQLLMWLKIRGDLTAQEIVKLVGESALTWLQQLHEAKKVIPLHLTDDGEFRWIVSDESDTYTQFPQTTASITFVLSRHIDHLLSFTESDLCERYPTLSLEQARELVDEWLQLGAIERAPHASDEHERLWTSAKVAAKIVRLSIQHARSKAEPATPARWCGQISMLQYALQGTQLRGVEGLRAVIERMQGLFIPLSHWESLIFPTRLIHYKKDDLDLLCASGEIRWIGRKEVGDKEGKLAFFLTDNESLYSPFLQPQSSAATNNASLLRVLEQGGASFLTKLSREMELAPSEVLEQLLELVWEGRVANDQFAPLRLHANTKNSNWARKGSGQGRWYALSSVSTQETKSLSMQDRNNDQHSPTLAWIHHLLKVYGIINRELVQKISPLSWDECYPVLKRLEQWGAMTRGTFIKGTTNLQFTTRELSDAIKQSLPEQVESHSTVLSAVDPANPFGLIMDWPHQQQEAIFARLPNNYLVLKGNTLMFWIERKGRRIYGLQSVDEQQLTIVQQAQILLNAIHTLLQRQKLVKIIIELWNGVAVLETDLGQQLCQIGAERDLHSLVVWSKS